MVTPLIDGRVSKEEFLTKIVDNVGEQQEHISNRVIKQERVFHSERERRLARGDTSQQRKPAKARSA